MKKIIIGIILFCFTESCGYSPMYSKSRIQTFNIEVIESKGDREINNSIRSELRRYSEELVSKKFIIKFNTKYEKVITSATSAGVASQYELKATTIFDIQLDKNNSIFSVTEKFTLDKDQNILDGKNYEKIIKSNFASTIVRKLILRLPVIQ